MKTEVINLSINGTDYTATDSNSMIVTITFKEKPVLKDLRGSKPR